MTVRHFCRLSHVTEPNYAEWRERAWQPIAVRPWDLPLTTQPAEDAAAAVATTGAHLVPVCPSKIIGIGKNYRAHAQEMGGAVPSEPLFFLKAPSALLEPGAPVVLPALSKRVDYEGELAVVIGKPARRVSVRDALDYVFGYTVACDLTARDLQVSDGQWARAKSFDSFCPLSPVITCGVDCSDVLLTTTVNGVIRQSARTREMVFNVAEIISHLSMAMTLLPGDLILTGTPDGVGPLAAGDDVTVAIEGLVPFSFKVTAEPTQPS